MPKTIPLSLRITQDDAVFLSELNRPETVTLSDKVRALIKEARETEGACRDYATGLAKAKAEFQKTQFRIKEQELNDGMHSELLSFFPEWLAEAFAYTLSVTEEGEAESVPDLTVIENGVVARVFRLLEQVARLGVTNQAPCYDPEIISREFKRLRELMGLLNSRINAKS